MVETIGAMVMMYGVYLELTLGGEIHFVMITIGAVIFSIGTGYMFKVRHLFKRLWQINEEEK